MTIRWIFALVVLGGVTAFAPAPRPKPAKVSETEKLRQKMQGTWERVPPGQAAVPGRVVVRPAVSRSTIQYVIKDDRWSFIRNTGGESRTTASYRMILDVSKNPPWLDLIREGTDQPFMKGILSLEGDTLKFVYVPGSSNTPRPTAFPSSDETRSGPIMILKRVAP